MIDFASLRGLMKNHKNKLIESTKTEKGYSYSYERIHSNTYVLCDTIIKCGKSEFKCHENILKKVKYFKKFIRFGQKRDENECWIITFDPEFEPIINIFLNILYSYNTKYLFLNVDNLSYEQIKKITESYSYKDYNHLSIDEILLLFNFCDFIQYDCSNLFLETLEILIEDIDLTKEIIDKLRENKDFDSMDFHLYYSEILRILIEKSNNVKRDIEDGDRKKKDKRDIEKIIDTLTFIFHNINNEWLEILELLNKHIKLSPMYFSGGQLNTDPIIRRLVIIKLRNIFKEIDVKDFITTIYILKMENRDISQLMELYNESIYDD